MSSDALVKCVAYKLKYHMNVIEREDGFSPSGNYFKYEKPVIYPMPPCLLSSYETDYSQRKKLFSGSSLENRECVLTRRKLRCPSIPCYSPTILDRRRKQRVVKIASKLLVTLGCYDDCDQQTRHKVLPRIQKRTSNLMNIHQRMQHFYEDSNEDKESQTHSEKESELIEQREDISSLDSDSSEKSDNNECSHDSDSYSSEKGESYSDVDSNHENESLTATHRVFPREKRVKLYSEGIVSLFKTSDGPLQINNILPDPYDILVENSTQTDLIDSVDQNNLLRPVNTEITSGSVTKYKIVVKTGNELGASTRAEVKLWLYGELGRTQPINLIESKTNKIKFQKGKEDHFFVEVFSVGNLEKIHIGHDRPELPYAWFLEQVTIHDLEEMWTYQFPCDQWFSGQGGDRKTYRHILLGHHSATSEDINNVPIDPLIQLLSETKQASYKNTINNEDISDSNYITALYDKLYISKSSDLESSQESSESIESESEKKVISVQNYIAAETQTENLQAQSDITSDNPDPETSESESTDNSDMSNISRQCSSETSSKTIN